MLINLANNKKSLRITSDLENLPNLFDNNNSLSDKKYDLKSSNFKYNVNNINLSSGGTRKSIQGTFEYEFNKKKFNKEEINNQISNSLSNIDNNFNNPSNNINNLIKIEEINNQSYYLSFKFIIFIIIVIFVIYEIFNAYNNIKLNIDQKKQSCLKEYLDNKCNYIIKTDINNNINTTDNKDFINDPPEYLLSFCKEKEICIAEDQIIFTEWILFNNNEINNINNNNQSENNNYIISNLYNFNSILVSLIIIFISIIIINRLF